MASRSPSRGAAASRTRLARSPRNPAPGNRSAPGSRAQRQVRGPRLKKEFQEIGSAPESRPEGRVHPRRRCVDPESRAGPRSVRSRADSVSRIKAVFEPPDHISWHSWSYDAHVSQARFLRVDGAALRRTTRVGRDLRPSDGRNHGGGLGCRRLVGREIVPPGGCRPMSPTPAPSGRPEGRGPLVPVIPPVLAQHLPQTV
jgi:hypothetical protein